MKFQVVVFRVHNFSQCIFGNWPRLSIVVVNRLPTPPKRPGFVKIFRQIGNDRPTCPTYRSSKKCIGRTCRCNRRSRHVIDEGRRNDICYKRRSALADNRAQYPERVAPGRPSIQRRIFRSRFARCSWCRLYHLSTIKMVFYGVGPILPAVTVEATALRGASTYQGSLRLHLDKDIAGNPRRRFRFPRAIQADHRHEPPALARSSNISSAVAARIHGRIAGRSNTPPAAVDVAAAP